MSSKEEIISLMARLTVSTGNFCIKRILSIKEREAYKVAINQCLSIIREGWTDISLIRLKIEGVRDDAQFLYKKKLFLSNETRLHNLAVDHCLDIVNSIETRFVTGGADDGPRGYAVLDYIDTEKEIY